MARVPMFLDPGGVSTFAHVDSNGWRGHVEYVQNEQSVNRILDECHAMATSQGGKRNAYNPQADGRLAQRVPAALFWDHMSKFEGGMNRYYTKDEWLTKLIMNPDYSRFRVWRGKV